MKRTVTLIVLLFVSGIAFSQQTKSVEEHIDLDTQETAPRTASFTNVSINGNSIYGSVSFKYEDLLKVSFNYNNGSFSGFNIVGLTPDALLKNTISFEDAKIQITGEYKIQDASDDSAMITSTYYITYDLITQKLH